MRNGYRIVDVDGHVQEPADLWERWLDPELLPDAPVLGANGWTWRGQPVTTKLSDSVRATFAAQTRQHYADFLAAGWSAASQLDAMDRMGVDVSYLYPTMGLFLWHQDDLPAALATGMTRAYNDWLHDFCHLEPSRLRPVTALSLMDVDTAVGEARRGREQYGTAAVYLRPNPVQGRTLASPELEPLWAYCESEGIAVGLHEGAHARVRTAGQDRYETDFSLWSCSHPMEMMMAFASLLEGGVLERHPQLRVAFLEAGCGWVPYWLWRLDERWENVAAEVASTVTMPPSRYFRRQCWVALEADEPYLGELVDTIGADRLLFASDYPHPDHRPDLTDALVALEGRLSPPVLRQILEQNADVFYGS
ncbi:MAG: amidohydrolase [Actinobacteria bacterium]|nr:MAG: amidohydrolase [Actinomycetota bacterium]